MKRWHNEELSLQNKLAAFREQFRSTLAGWWSWPEVIPYGYQYQFNNDGTGTFFEYRGFACDETFFAWRSIGDWRIEINRSDDPEHDEWDLIEYDFVIADISYGPDVVLCEASLAEKYRKNPQDVKAHELSFNFHDGPFMRIAGPSP